MKSISNKLNLKDFKDSAGINFLRRVRNSINPRKIFQFGTLFTAGFIYYNRENIVQKLDDFYGRYFQYYNEKNTDLQKLVRDNLEIPILYLLMKKFQNFLLFF
jgi:hypothetical protein